MIIGIDCRKIRDGGIGTYTRNLLVQWHKQNVAARFILFHAPGDECLLDFPREFAEKVPHDSPKYSLTELFSFNRPLKERRADLFFSPHYTLPFAIPCPSVVTIHDLIHLKYKSRFGFAGQGYAGIMIRHAVKDSRIVFTDSEHSKEDIAALVPNQAAKIRVAFPGVDRTIFKPYPEADIRKYKLEKALPDKFILYVGALKPHKNPEALVAIARHLKYPVVIATRDRKSFDKILRENAGLGESFIRTDIESDFDLALLYNSSRLLVHPAYYEGFGLPPLEAMACGLPVVCSNASSLPEVTGDAALTFEPNNSAGLMEQINQGWHDDNIRSILINRGLARAEVFSWSATAAKIFELFIEAAEI